MKIWQLAVICIISVLVVLSSAQERKIRWKKKIFKGPQAVEIFHSTILVNLPTTEVLQKKNLEFIVAHRFIPSLGEGIDALFGADGPAYMQLSLSYAPVTNLMVALERSNRENHYQFWLKYKFWEKGSGEIPMAAALKAGAGVAAEDPALSGRSRFQARNWQYFAMVPINLKLMPNLMAGVVPGFLYNSYIYSASPQTSITLGATVEYFVTSSMGIYAEVNSVVRGYRSEGATAFAVGFETETGGHFFKIFLTNSTRINSAQYLSGVDRRIEAFSDLHLGFTITRLLRFGEKW